LGKVSVFRRFEALLPWLLPENWFNNPRKQLGSRTFLVKTNPVNGKSIEFIVKKARPETDPYVQAYHRHGLPHRGSAVREILMAQKVRNVLRGTTLAIEEPVKEKRLEVTFELPYGFFRDSQGNQFAVFKKEPSQNLLNLDSRTGRKVWLLLVQKGFVDMDGQPAFMLKRTKGGKTLVAVGIDAEFFAKKEKVKY